MFALEASSTFSPPFWMSIQMAATVTVLSRPPSPCCFGALHVCVGGLNLLATSLGFYIDGSHGDRQLVTLQVDLYIGGCRMRLLEWSLCLNIGITMTPFTCTFYLCNLTGPRHQVIHQRCPDHDYVDVPGLGRRSMAIRFRTGLFPHDRSRFMTQIPKPNIGRRQETDAVEGGPGRGQSTFEAGATWRCSLGPELEEATRPHPWQDQ